MISITESAAKQIQTLLTEDNSTSKLRIFVQGGGCSGFSYGFTLDDSSDEDDIILKDHGIEVLVDPMSMQYLTGASVDYKDSIMGASFTINNPQATSTCGCGSSFGV